jgi:quercetin dioxygenase-like cupin family protein
MKTASVMLAAGALAATAAMFVSATQAEEGHKLVTAKEIKWSPGPPSIPPGAQIAVLYGDPSKDSLFSMRIKVPKGYRIAPHTHPKPEIVTVISGTARLGMGDSGDPAKAKVLPAGSFFALSPGTPHYFSADVDTVIQLNSVGPWSLTYVNPKDDPRQKTK